MHLADLHVIPFALAPDADRYAGNPTTDWIRHPGVDSLYFLVVEGAGGTGYGTITVNCSAVAAGSSPTAIAFEYKTITGGLDFDLWGGYSTATTAGVEVAAGATKTTVVKVRFDQLTSQKPFVALTITETDSTAVDAAVFALCLSPRPNAGVSRLA